MTGDTAPTRGGEILARLDRIPVWPYPRPLMWVVGFGFFFAFFDIVTIGFALPVLTKTFGVSSELASWSVTSGLIGYIIGSFLDSRIADRFGRRLSLLLSVSFFTVGSLLSATSPDIWWLIFWRVISGMGIGAEISAVSTYLGELSPAPKRGRYTAWTIAAGMLGFAVVPFVALALVPAFEWGWRALFVVGGLGGLVIGLMRRHLPHSVHWLLNRDRFDEAAALVRACEERAAARLGHALPPPGPAVAEPPIGHGALRHMARAPYLGRLLLIAGTWFLYYVGNYAWLTLAPTLLVNKGYTLTHSIAFMIVTGLGFVAGAVMAALLGDRVERRMAAIAVVVVWTAALAMIGWQPSNLVIVACGFIASTTIGLLIPILYTYTAENFATGFRATGVSATDGFGHLGGALAPIIVLAAYRAWDFSGAFYVMALTGLAAAVLLAFGIRTTGRPLHDISR